MYKEEQKKKRLPKEVLALVFFFQLGLLSDSSDAPKSGQPSETAKTTTVGSLGWWGRGELRDMSRFCEGLRAMTTQQRGKKIRADRCRCSASIVGRFWERVWERWLADVFGPLEAVYVPVWIDRDGSERGGMGALLEEGIWACGRISCIFCMLGLRP